jgi:hypothetical protein
MALSSIASVRRLANLWVDLSTKRCNELLEALDAPSRDAVIERMNEIRDERNSKRSKQDDA